MRHIIIGGSVAGISAVKAVRENDPSGDITVISGEKTGPYYRPLIPLLIAGQKGERDIMYTEDPLREKNITSVLGTVIGVDAPKKEVLLASGERLLFDSLLIATGGAALKPSIPGLEGNNVYPLRNMAQALGIRDAAVTAKSVVVIGGGLVGIKAALALREQGMSPGRAPREVTVIEMLPEIMNGRLDRRGAAIVRTAVEQKDIAVVTGQAVSGIIRTQSALSGVKLRSGRMIKADLVVVAAGVKPNIAFLKGAGIKTSTGVLVNEYLQTNVADVFAAGDVVEGRELLSGKKTISGLWSNALEMGRIAGMNMAGKKVKYPGFLSVMNATDIAGIPFISVGMIEPEGGRYETISHEDENGYWKLVLDGEYLVGAVSVGDLRNAGIYTNLIKNRIPISRAKEKIIKKKAGYVDFLSV
ncbi:MAG TPA: FAD-dependent oxidoreductase [Nitrospirota bacterium]|nr:FAD-dependent oxidoreductase [Nitrospirota bacterium]